MAPTTSPTEPSGAVRSIDMPEGTYLLREQLDGHWVVQRPDGIVLQEAFNDRFTASIAVAERQV